MAFVHGKNSAVYLGAIDLSPYFDSFDLAADADTAETTTFTSTWKSVVTGTLASKADYSGFYDPTELTLGTVMLGQIPSELTYLPGGATAIGDRARLMSAYEVTFGTSSPVGGAVVIKGSFMSAGSIGIGDLLHPLAEDTNTTTGAEKDDAAASATGWTAHLHVMAVDAGSWVIKLQDAAVSNTYSDLTGGAFTAATTATSQRLQSAASTTALRRYVRYVATRTGGSAGDGITFALAYSRTY